MPASLQSALIPIIVMLLSAGAVKLGIDAKEFADKIYFLATALAALIVAVYGSVMGWLQTKRVERAEGTVPGITTPTGPKARQTTILNDPTSPTPPKVISKDQPSPPLK